MHSCYVLNCRVLNFVHLNLSFNHNCNWPPIGHPPNRPPVDNGQWIAKELLEPVLEPSQSGPWWVWDLLVDKGLAIGKDWHQRPSMLDCQLYESFPPVQDQCDLIGISVVWASEAPPMMSTAAVPFLSLHKACTRRPYLRKYK